MNKKEAIIEILKGKCIEQCKNCGGYGELKTTPFGFSSKMSVTYFKCKCDYGHGHMHL